MKNRQDDDRYPDQLGRSLRALSDYLGLGIQIAAGFVFFVFAGYWADGQLGTSPLFLIIGMFMGMGGMVLVLMKVLKTANRKQE
ncbi:MAG: AtpZ/AtpI family protein [Chlorobium sp.]|uniref:AtpZ/AtpI family protein n=1 Tax=Chlorobium sp. TaxID=1095 RepID=UPI001D621242|nr:AtpZ/AtpI family protein [Chlorobium sp.]MBN1279017.1 AtpZ/AtpI family protein [Chlorobiaceae bacterium]MCF8217110.1 AtpZ/AtpI family protein [Chlorobium sp.]MCF8271956.1 AtpZ/AtpI family protein [Chlorobium sp.]MCF8288327.1 AtpZ/AtpI family protein [Chlorobium sp.]MCF8291928.1 AtpZ/AtpI family protein [Chlorobium sp.]